MRWRNVSSSIRPANQEKRRRPAVYANGRRCSASCGPGAWPTSITRAPATAPVTGIPTTFGQARQAWSNSRWRSSAATIATPMKRLFALLLFLPLTTHAWTRASDEKIAKKSAALAPPDLRLLLDHFDSDYKLGLERAQAEEGA